MARLLPRILMWVFIVAAVWYFAQQQRPGEPDPQQQEAMLEAARHYRALQGGGRSEVPAPEAEKAAQPQH